MFKKLENWAFNVFAGKLLARAAVTIAAFVAGPVIQGALSRAGVHATIDPKELQAGLVLAAHAAYEWLKAKRNGSPAPAPEAPKA